MVAAEFRNSISTIRIHDEYCDMSADHHISHLSRIISASYKRRQLSNQEEPLSPEVVAANIAAAMLET